MGGGLRTDRLGGGGGSEKQMGGGGGRQRDRVGQRQIGVGCHRERGGARAWDTWGGQGGGRGGQRGGGAGGGRERGERQRERGEAERDRKWGRDRQTDRV